MFREWSLIAAAAAANERTARRAFRKGQQAQVIHRQLSHIYFSFYD